MLEFKVIHFMHVLSIETSQTHMAGFDKILIRCLRIVRRIESVLVKERP